LDCCSVGIAESGQECKRAEEEEEDDDGGSGAHERPEVVFILGIETYCET
jgi:hypothetical protein